MVDGCKEVSDHIPIQCPLGLLSGVVVFSDTWCSWALGHWPWEGRAFCMLWSINVEGLFIVHQMPESCTDGIE